MSALPPGPKSPAFFQLLHWYREPLAQMDECQARFGDSFTLRFPNTPPIVVFSHPAAIKRIFTADPADVFAGEASAFMKPVLGENSLLLLDGPRHLRERRLMMPPFHGDRMRAYGEVMRDVTAQAMARWPREDVFPILAESQAITLDVILRAVFGLQEGPRLIRMRDLLTHYGKVSTSAVSTLALLLPRDRAATIMEFGVDPLAIGGHKVDLSRWMLWTAPVRAQRAVDAMLYEEFAQRRAEGAERSDVLSMLMAARDESGQAMTDAELRDEMMTLLLAGHETSAVTLAWTMHHILEHEEVATQIKSELSRVIGDGPVRPDDVAKLEYLDATIKESLRLTPILPTVSRVLKRQQRIGEHDLPAGTWVLACVYLAHRRPEAWPNPEVFDPQRFLGKKSDPYSFFPFGGGARRCIGMAFASYEMKIVLAQIMSRAILRRRRTSKLRMVRRGVTLAPSDGVLVTASTA